MSSNAVRRSLASVVAGLAAGTTNLIAAANPDFSPLIVGEELLAHTIMFGIPIAGIVVGLSRLHHK